MTAEQYIRALDKEGLRREVLCRRDSISGELRRQKNEKIIELLLGLDEFRNAHTVLFYASFRSEVDTFAAMSYSLSRQKSIALPKVDKATRSLKLYDIISLNELRRGYFNIPEPPSSDTMERQVHDVDLIIVPGVAFDLRCNRLGYGQGFYDKLLSGVRDRSIKCDAEEFWPPLIALSYEAQIVASIPAEAHDIRMDKIITEKGIKDCHG
ncbi:MAG: 5-formyltetrahydrofolate cyclo-ligase [Dissulfurispiraceae bacterium]